MNSRGITKATALGAGLVLLWATPAAATGAVALSKATGIAPGGETVTINGSGFDPTQGIYVQYCVQPTGALGSAAGRAARCRPDQHAPNTYWVHSPTFGSPDEAPLNADGSFSVQFLLEPSFTASGGDVVDCSATQCGVFTRRDHNGGSTDYSQDTFTPVAFAAPGQATSTTTSTSTAATTSTTATTMSTTTSTSTSMSTSTTSTTAVAVLGESLPRTGSGLRGAMVTALAFIALGALLARSRRGARWGRPSAGRR